MTIKHLQIQENMGRKKVMQNEKGGLEKSTFNNVYLNTLGFCKTSKLIQRWRYVNTNIKDKDLSPMLNIS